MTPCTEEANPLHSKGEVRVSTQDREYLLIMVWITEMTGNWVLRVHRLDQSPKPAPQSSKESQGNCEHGERECPRRLCSQLLPALAVLQSPLPNPGFLSVSGSTLLWSEGFPSEISLFHLWSRCRFYLGPSCGFGLLAWTQNTPPPCPAFDVWHIAWCTCSWTIIIMEHECPQIHQQ